MLDASAQKLLDQMRAAGRPPMEALTLEQARAGYRKSRLQVAVDPEDVASVDDVEIPSTGGHRCKARLYRGTNAPSQRAPVVVLFHGGGWVLGDLDTHDSLCRTIANAADCAVLSVDYRLAPEWRFPVAVDDAHAAVHWVANAAGSRLDAERIAVMGDSAGGNLAAVLALELRGRRPLRLQILLYPCLDLRLGHASYERVGRDFNLTAASMRWFRAQYAPDENDWTSPRLSPLAATDLTGVAPAVLASGGCDPLCDEAAEYEGRLRAAGVPVKHFHYPGQMHGFVTSGKVLPEGRAATALIAAELKQALA